MTSTAAVLTSGGSSATFWVESRKSPVYSAIACIPDKGRPHELTTSARYCIAVASLADRNKAIVGQRA